MRDEDPRYGNIPSDRLIKESDLSKVKPLIHFKIDFDLRDIWIGLYWTAKNNVIHNYPTYRAVNKVEMHIYICLIPCFPIHIWWVEK